ncbi:MAG: redoxin family protein [Pseudomonadota bacterium]
MHCFQRKNRSVSAVLIGSILFSGSALTASSLANDTRPSANNPAPAWSGVTSTGETISLDQFSGKIVVMEWTNHGCPFVQKHYKGGNMQAIQAVAAKTDDVVWVTVISSAPGKQGHVSGAEADALTRDRGAMPDYVVLDEAGTIGRDYGARTTPQIFVINGGGTLKYNGAMDDNPSAKLSSLDGATNYALGAMTAVMVGDDPNPATTKPYGCSVKYK